MMQKSTCKFDTAALTVEFNYSTYLFAITPSSRQCYNKCFHNLFPFFQNRRSYLIIIIIALIFIQSKM